MDKTNPPVRSVFLLGRLQVMEHGKPLSIPSGKVSDLLAFLALNAARPQRREPLIDLLWPEAPPDRGRAVFSTTLYRLRQALGEGWLKIDGETIQFQPEDGWVDVVAFETACKQGDIAALESGAALYQGDLLPEVYADWVVPRRAILQNLHISALTKLAQEAERQGVDQRVFTYFHKLSFEDPLNEAAHRGLMRVYLRQGRFAVALQQYKQLEQVLERELGVAPMAETQALAAQVQSERDLGVEEDLVRPRLIGRRRERAQLLGRVEALQRGSGGVVLLEGQAGMGKTRLLENLAEAAAWRGAVVVWGKGADLAGVSPHAPLDQALQAAFTTAKLETLRQKFSPANLAVLAGFVPRLQTSAPMHFRSPPDIPGALSEGLRQLGELAPHVLILDDVQWAGEEFWGELDFLEALEESRVLLILSYRLDSIWSQAQAQAWEALQAIDRTLSPLRIRLEGLAEDQCAELAAALGRKIGPQQLREVCQTTQGNPLHVYELLASDGIGTTESLLMRIRSRLERLTPEAMGALEIAAVLGKFFRHATWQTVGGEAILASIPDLIQHRFIEETPDGYVLQHDLTRELIYQGIDPARLVALHQQVGAALAIEEAEPEILAWHFENGALWNQASRQNYRAGQQAMERYAFDAAVSHLDRAIEQHRKSSDPDPFTTLALLRARGQALSVTLATSAWVADLDELEALAERLGDTPALLEVLVSRMKLAVLSADPEAMEGTARRALTLAEELGDPAIEASILNDYGWHLSETLGKNPEAIEYLERAVRLVEASGENHSLVTILTNLSFAQRADGRCRASHDSASRALAITETFPELYPAQAYALKSLAEVSFELAQYEAARGTFQSAIQRLADLSDPWSVGAAFYNYGLCASAMGQHAEAISAMERLVALGVSVGIPPDSAYGVWHRAGLARAQINAGELDLGQRTLAELNPDGIDSGRALLTLDTVYGWLHLQRGEPARAQARLEPAMTAWRATRHVDDLHCPLLHALASGRTGDGETAASSLKMAEEVLVQSESRRLLIFALFVRAEIKGDEDALRAATQELDKQAALFNSQALRQTFLTKVQLHQEVAARWKALDGRTDPPPVRFRLARANAPLGVPLSEADQIEVRWTVDAGEKDREVLAGMGKTGLRRHRLQRLVAEAEAQGAAPTDGDLAKALGVSRRTILRDMQMLKEQGVRLKTRRRK